MITGVADTHAILPSAVSAISASIDRSDYSPTATYRIDVALRLRTIEPNRDTPLVVITGSTDPAARRKGFEAGAIAFVPKPFTAAQFRAVVATVVP